MVRRHRQHARRVRSPELSAETADATAEPAEHLAQRGGYSQNGERAAGMVITGSSFYPRQILWVVAGVFRLGGASIVSVVECHRLLLDELWLAIDEIVHHDDVLVLTVVRPRGNVTGLDPNRCDASVIKLDGEEGEVSIARRGRNETTVYASTV